MEIIKNNISGDEIVKWEKHRIINYKKEVFKSLILAIVLLSVLMTLIGLFFWYVPSWGGTFYFAYTDIVVHPLIIYISIMSIFISVSVIAVGFAIILAKRGFQRLDLRLSDLRSYHLIHVLTNERWIQKDFRSLLYFDEKKLPAEVFRRINDITFINLEYVEKISITKIRSNYNFSFHFQTASGPIQGLVFTVKFKFKDFQELRNVIVQFVPLEILKE